MEIKEIRRERLRLWFLKRKLPEKEKSYFSQLINNPEASFGEKAAKRIEDVCGMPKGYLDGLVDAPPADGESGAAPATAQLPPGITRSDHALMELAIKEIDEGIKELGLNLSPTDRHMAIYALYEQKKHGKPMTFAEAWRLIKIIIRPPNEGIKKGELRQS